MIFSFLSSSLRLPMSPPDKSRNPPKKKNLPRKKNGGSLDDGSGRNWRALARLGLRIGALEGGIGGSAARVYRRGGRRQTGMAATARGEGDGGGEGKGRRSEKKALGISGRKPTCVSGKKN